jgi:type IV pilus modification protein PilV
MRRTAGNHKGFTLLETLVALVIITIGLLAVATMQGVAINATSIANKNSVASSLAQHVAEDLLSTSITGTILTTSVANQPYMLDRVNNTPQINIRGSGTYTAQYTTTTSPPLLIGGASVPGTTQVSVTVFYVAVNGVTTAVSTFTTYKRAI